MKLSKCIYSMLAVPLTLPYNLPACFPPAIPLPRLMAQPPCDPPCTDRQTGTSSCLASNAHCKLSWGVTSQKF